jgi:hypothetical protein
MDKGKQAVREVAYESLSPEQMETRIDRDVERVVALIGCEVWPEARHQYRLKLNRISSHRLLRSCYVSTDGTSTGSSTSTWIRPPKPYTPLASPRTQT